MARPSGPCAFEEPANSSFVFSNLQPSLLRNSYGKQSGREAGSSSVWPGQAGPLLLRNSRTLALFSATCNRRSFAIRMESNPAGKRVPLPYGPAKRAPAFEEPPRRTFPFSRLRSRLFFNRDQFVAELMGLPFE